MANGDETGAIVALAIEDRGAESVQHSGRTNMGAARKEKQVNGIAHRKIDIVDSDSNRDRRIGDDLLQSRRRSR
ncbi:MAG TPA: hypothetical protein VN904_05850 [Chthoniobacterales bacterium]|nr:hypothetical protein [Chthoniobacterales bacterium]